MAGENFFLVLRANKVINFAVTIDALISQTVSDWVISSLCSNVDALETRISMPFNHKPQLSQCGVQFLRAASVSR